jgi:IclR family transcriptional regulator, KDG regulon repressor
MGFYRVERNAAAGYTIESVARALTLLELFSSAAPDLDLQTVSRRAAMPKSSAFRYLSALERLGYIERDAATGMYHLGMKLFQLGQVAVSRLDVRTVARPIMQELARRYQETINLGMLNGQQVLLIEVVDGTRSIRMGSRLGERDPLHTSAVGKAILAYQGLAAIEALVKADALPRLTAHTLTEPDALARDLEGVRERGYSLDREEGEIGLCCVGIPIFDHRGQVLSALSLSAPAARLPLDTAHAIGRELVAYSVRMSEALYAPATLLPARQGARKKLPLAGGVASDTEKSGA